MDINYSDKNKEKKMEIQHQTLLGILIGVIAIGFAPGILLSLVLILLIVGFSYLTGGSIYSTLFLHTTADDGDNLFISFLFGGILLALVATIYLINKYKRAYLSWGATLKKYLRLSFICVCILVGMLLLTAVIASSFSKKASASSTQMTSEPTEAKKEDLIGRWKGNNVFVTFNSDGTTIIKNISGDDAGIEKKGTWSIDNGALFLITDGKTSGYNNAKIHTNNEDKVTLKMIDEKDNYELIKLK